VAAVVVETDQAPPAIVFLQAEQCQIPTAVLLTESLPQKVHVYRACCDISIFFDLFTQGSTITGTVFTRDSDFLGAF